MAWFQLHWPGADLAAFAAKAHELGPRVGKRVFVDLLRAPGLRAPRHVGSGSFGSRSTSVLCGEVVEAEGHPEIWHLIQYEELVAVLSGFELQGTRVQGVPDSISKTLSPNLEMRIMLSGRTEGACP